MRLYFKFISMQLRCQMEYKFSFFMMSLGQFLTSFTTFLGVYFMFDRFDSVNGFELSEVMLCFSVVLMSFSLTECFVRGFDRHHHSGQHHGHRRQRILHVRRTD